MHISIIIPAHNEERRIKETLLDYIKFFKSKKVNFEIYVILNGCVDNTLAVVKSIKFKELKYRDYKEPIGKGGALIEGFKLAKGDLIAYTDADDATKPWQLYHLIENIGTYDSIIGSRWMIGSVIQKQTFIRRFCSRGFNLLVRLFLNLQFYDTQCGAKVFKRKALYGVLESLKTKGWAFDVNILYYLKRRGYTIKEVPITWEDREGSNLKLRKAIPGMFIALLKLKFTKR